MDPYLAESIAHWKKQKDKENPRDIQIGADWCALCRHYIECTGCPVREKTGKRGCAGTPYYEADQAYFRFLDGHTIHKSGSGIITEEQLADRRKAWQDAAQAEIDFLESCDKGDNV